MNVAIAGAPSQGHCPRTHGCEYACGCCTVPRGVTCFCAECAAKRRGGGDVDPAIWPALLERMRNARVVEIERDFDNEPEPFI